MDRLCDNLEKALVEKLNTANQMTLAVYVGDDKEHRCLCYVTRNMLDPEWRVTVVQSRRYFPEGQRVIKWLPPILLRTKPAFECFVKNGLKHAKKNCFSKA